MVTTTLDKLKIMVASQGELNTKVAGADWGGRGLDWTMAMYKESVELLESLDVDWWKKSEHGNITDFDTYDEWLVASNEEFDLRNVRIEVVDLFHFMISMLMEESIDDEGWLKELSVILKVSDGTIGGSFETTGAQRLALLESVKTFIGVVSHHALYNVSMLLVSFAAILSSAQMTFDDLFKIYSGKNVLNKVRQSNGYKEGNYQKIWGDVEDNVVMVGIVEMMTQEELEKDLYDTLDNFYKAMVA